MGYGPENFLWLSDVSLFITFFATLLGSPLLMSMAFLGVFPFEFTWNIDYFGRLFTGHHLTGLSSYMFDSSLSYLLRGLSFFHTVLIFIWAYCLIKWGYDRRALYYVVFVYWIDVILVYFFSNPVVNINQVFVPYIYEWDWMPSFVWVLLLMIFVPLLFFVPLHLVLSRMKTYTD